MLPMALIEQGHRVAICDPDHPARDEVAGVRRRAGSEQKGCQYGASLPSTVIDRVQPLHSL